MPIPCKPTTGLPTLCLLVLLNGCWLLSQAQVSDTTQLFLTLKDLDRQLFDIGFKTCRLELLPGLISDDFEFYHDQSGITPSYQAFVETLKAGLCSGNVNTRRELEESSLLVYPLFDNGKLYGALQNGVHRFYNLQSDGTYTLGSTAKFSHLWLLEENTWKLSRVISYDHH